tara:strand:- start:142602 stop:143069 length:468 start_codon:yes stop_codon:yes gene_type:complete
MSKEKLKTIGLPADLSPSSAEQLADLADLFAWPEQQILFREGEIHSRLYWIEQGRVRLEMSGARSGATSLLTVGPGDLLAWSALLGDGRMTATATTTEPTTLIAFDAGALLNLCEENHDIGYKVMYTVAKLLSKRLIATRLQLLDLFQNPPGVGR